MHKTKANQMPKMKSSSTKKESMAKTVKLPPIRRLGKRLTSILNAMNHCQTLKKKMSKRSFLCEQKLKNFILKFVEPASDNRFKYIFWILIWSKKISLSWFIQNIKKSRNIIIRVVINNKKMNRFWMIINFEYIQNKVECFCLQLFPVFITRNNQSFEMFT